jgi:T4 superinfection immunity protein
MSTDLVIIPHRPSLRRKRVRMAIWFALIWLAFLALVLSSAAQNIHVFYFIAASLAFYFVPAIIAFYRRHQHRWAIAVLNLLLGWTGLGWVAGESR